MRKGGDKVGAAILIAVLFGFIGILVTGPYAWVAFWPCTLMGFWVAAKLLDL